MPSSCQKSWTTRLLRTVLTTSASWNRNTHTSSPLWCKVATWLRWAHTSRPPSTRSRRKPSGSLCLVCSAHSQLRKTVWTEGFVCQSELEACVCGLRLSLPQTARPFRMYCYHLHSTVWTSWFGQWQRTSTAAWWYKHLYRRGNLCLTCSLVCGPSWFYSTSATGVETEWWCGWFLDEDKHFRPVCLRALFLRNQNQSVNTCGEDSTVTVSLAILLYVHTFWADCDLDGV